MANSQCEGAGITKAFVLAIVTMASVVGRAVAGDLSTIGLGTSTQTTDCIAGLKPGTVVRIGRELTAATEQSRNAAGRVTLRFHTSAQACGSLESIVFSKLGEWDVPFIVGPLAPFTGWVELVRQAVVPPLADKADFVFTVQETSAGPALVASGPLDVQHLGLPHKAEFNGDAYQDLVWRNYATGQNVIWMMHGPSVHLVVDLPAIPNPDYRLEGAADFNFDGRSDLLWRNEVTGQNAVWFMNATALESIGDLPGLPNADYRFEGTGDFNGDGKPDVVLRNAMTGQNAVWLLDGLNVAAIIDLPGLPNPDYHVEGIADFTGDLKYDIVWRNAVTGQNALWIMDGNVLSGVVDLPALPNAGYHIDAVGDLNRDFRPDIIWRNPATGQNAVWLMDGTSVGAIRDLPPIANRDFRIGAPR